jgi:hypothetical protein
MRVFVAVVVVLSGCRSVDTELYARQRRELARFQHGFAKLEAATNAPLPAPWAAGQFAVWAVTANDETTLIEAQVESASASGATVTVTSLSPRQRLVATVTYEHQPKDVADARASVRQIVRRRTDAETFTYRFGSGQRDEMLDALQPLWATLISTATQGDALTVSTAAATLQGCTPADAEFLYRHASVVVHGWSHPAVPISGFVRGKSSDGREEIELMEYGWSGGAPQL